MIRNTFSILNGIGTSSEMRLWRQGITDWDAFINTDQIGFINSAKKTGYDGLIRQYIRNIDEKNIDFFRTMLKYKDHWRMFDTFRDSVVCLDIETNGYPENRGGYATVVGLFNGVDYKCFIRGENLSSERVSAELARYKYLVTYFGSVFDMPFLSKTMGIKFSGLHFDVCFAAKKLGFKGGLKGVETSLGMAREDGVAGLNGYDAVKLWLKAKKGNDKALKLLTRYNKYDTVNLYAIAESIYAKLKEASGIHKFL